MDLPSWFRRSSILLRQRKEPCSSFVEERVTGSKGSISKEMDFSFFISGLLQDSDTSGQGLSPKLNSWHGNSSPSWWRALIHYNPDWSARSIRSVLDELFVQYGEIFLCSEALQWYPESFFESPVNSSDAQCMTVCERPEKQEWSLTTVYHLLPMPSCDVWSVGIMTTAPAAESGCL